MNRIGYEERELIYRAAIGKFGADAQEWMVVEEMGELQRALAKLRRGRIQMSEVIDEIADVTIMLEQLRIILNVNDPVCERMDYKIRRLQKMTEDTP